MGEISRQYRWAQEARAKLMRQLGSRCVACGATEGLTFDCIRPAGNHHHKMGSLGRIGFYRDQARRCNLQILCLGCNSRKGAKANPAFRPTPAISAASIDWQI
jgi:5-methylcytosine-specific restriction endonuclease McrA